MKAVVDANIFFSALLKKGITRHIWFDPSLELCAPKFMLAEFGKYEAHLLKKFSGSAVEFAELRQRLLSQVRLVQDGELGPYMPAAASLSNDAKDWLYLACALNEGSILWSNDKGFKKQGRVTVRTTDEMAQDFGLF